MPPFMRHNPRSNLRRIVQTHHANRDCRHTSPLISDDRAFTFSELLGQISALQQAIKNMIGHDYAAALEALFRARWCGLPARVFAQANASPQRYWTLAPKPE